MPERQMAEPQQAPKETEVSNYAREQIHEAAVRGIQGTGTRLPHLNKIQASFGRHDISGVRAFTGGAAVQATAAMGAEAYTFNKQVAFNTPNPSLHTAAHEAAHAIQQEGGVQLKGGIGEVGDPYERHADAVADQVVQGRSAEGLLDGYVRKRAPIQTAVQMAPAHKGDPTGAANSSIWNTRSGNLDKLDGTGNKMDRAGEVEAVLIPGKIPAGSQPNVNILGWYWVHQFDGTDAKNGQWVRFHILNENLGGSGDEPKNLVPTTHQTNHCKLWKDFEKETKDKALTEGKIVHFYAEIDYYAAADALVPADPGAVHLPFFPKNIKAVSSYWDANTWKPIPSGDVKLLAINPPPTNAAVNPVFLRGITESAIANNFPKLGASFGTLFYGGTWTATKIGNLNINSSLQNVYDAVLDGVGFDRITRPSMQNIDPVDWLNNRWDVLETALKDIASKRPLRVVAGWDPAKAGPVTKAKPQAQIEREAKAAEDEKRAAEEAAKRKKEQAESDERHKQFMADMYAFSAARSVSDMKAGKDNVDNKIEDPKASAAMGHSGGSHSAAAAASTAVSHLSTAHASSAEDPKDLSPRHGSGLNRQKIIADTASRELQRLLEKMFGKDDKKKGAVWGKWKQHRNGFYKYLLELAAEYSNEKFEDRVERLIEREVEKLLKNLLLK